MHGETVIIYPNADIFKGKVVNNEMQGDGKSRLRLTLMLRSVCVE